MIRPCVFSLLVFSLCAASGPASLAARPALNWERMHTTAQPARLFMRLGLTHITRLGYTRDGAQKSDPDAQFPPGLTDVVPLDAEHVLLVRGTAAGRAAFRRRVSQTDAQMRLPRWHVEAFLEKADASPPSPPADPALPSPDEVAPAGEETAIRGTAPPEPAVLDIPDAPTPLTVPDATGTRTYLLDVNNAPAGSGDVLVTVRPDLAVSALPVAGLTLPAPPAVWGAPQTVRVRSGTAAVLTDKAAARDAARAKLRLPVSVSPEGDVILRLTVTPFVPVVPVPVTTAPVVPAAP